MQALRVVFFAAFVFLAGAAQGGLRHQQEASPTAMAGLEGEACGEEEYGRYKTIVCEVSAACKCADSICALDWCAEYVHNWNKACLLRPLLSAHKPVVSGTGTAAHVSRILAVAGAVMTQLVWALVV